MWIEIPSIPEKTIQEPVEARESLVDRNHPGILDSSSWKVEARESLVDRNMGRESLATALT